MDGAVQTVIETMQLGIPVARIELLDEAQIDAVNRYSRLDYPVKPTLLFEFHGTSTGGRRRARGHGAGAGVGARRLEFRVGHHRGPHRLWQARHATYYAALALRPGCKAWVTDVCVPISALAACVLETRRTCRRRH
jgi:D-lactate dehydrogenase (cytochrome)